MSTKPPAIVVAQPVDTEGLSKIRTIVPDWTITCVGEVGPDDDLPTEMLRDCTVLFANFAPPNLAAMERLQWMQLGSAGYTQLLQLPFRSMGVCVTNASGVNDVPIAEWCLLMMMTFERNLPMILRNQEEHCWMRAERFQSELRGRRVGIIGYGNIGREAARLCRSLGLEVWAMGRGPIGSRVLRYALPGTGDPEGIMPHRCFALSQMEQFLPSIDYLILTAALNPATHGLLGERELLLLPRSAVILNPARAHLVDEAAFARALREGWVAGAALDSHYREPMEADDPVWSLPNVVLTPHISGSNGSPHYLARLWELFALNLDRYRRGEPLLNEVSLDDLRAQ